MKDMSRNRSTRVGFWSALAGGAAGFLLGILVAPEKGQKARRRLAYQFEHTADRAVLWIQRLLNSRVESEARRTGDALVADAEEQAEHIRSDIEALLKELRKHEESSR